MSEHLQNEETWHKSEKESAKMGENPFLFESG